MLGRFAGQLTSHPLHLPPSESSVVKNSSVVVHNPNVDALTPHPLRKEPERSNGLYFQVELTHGNDFHRSPRRHGA